MSDSSGRRPNERGGRTWPTSRRSKELKNTGYEIFIGILSILSIVNLVLLYVVEDPNLDTVLSS